ncbi:MAG: dTDP-4-dehydrorhamnose reductase [Bacteroidales bacterium]|nr:dTDP-4-dehydrorhamnose reductase [Bacteroidales bacterium]
MQKKRIDILGANGQLGNELRLLSARYPECEFVFSDVADVDITDQAQLHAHLEKIRPQVVVNCAAYTAVDKAETEGAVLAEAVNHKAVSQLAAFTHEFSYLLIHISTDYVFDGTSCKPYLETDTCHPISVYGRTKRAGEEAVLSEAKRAVILRTAWLYSAFGNNFVKTMLRLGKERPEVKVVTDQIGSPTYAADLADAVMRWVEREARVQDVQLYHFTNEGVCSWYDFARSIIARVSSNCRVLPIPSEAYPAPAPRPFYSVLDKRKIKQVLQMEIPHWEDALQRCLTKLL